MSSNEQYFKKKLQIFYKHQFLQHSFQRKSMPKSIVFSHKISRSQIIFQHFETQQLHFAPFSFSNYSPVRQNPSCKKQLLVLKTSAFYTLFTPKSRFFISKAKDNTSAQREKLCIQWCILHHFTLRFAPFHLAFCTIQRCVLHHLALRFAANSIAFCCIQLCVLLQNAH